MLTESCVTRDEYLTSAVRTKEGDKAGSNQPPARDPVQFKLELSPNYLRANVTIGQTFRGNSSKFNLAGTLRLGRP